MDPEKKKKKKLDKGSADVAFLWVNPHSFSCCSALTSFHFSFREAQSKPQSALTRDVGLLKMPRHNWFLKHFMAFINEMSLKELLGGRETRKGGERKRESEKQQQ